MSDENSKKSQEQKLTKKEDLLKMLEGFKRDFIERIEKFEKKISRLEKHN